MELFPIADVECGYLYVPDAFDNTVRAYSIHFDGTLTAVSGSPFAAMRAADVMTIP